MYCATGVTDSQAVITLREAKGFHISCPSYTAMKRVPVHSHSKLIYLLNKINNNNTKKKQKHGVCFIVCSATASVAGPLCKVNFVAK